LARPDLLVAPGLLGGSTIFSPEQLVIDVEVIQRCKRLSRGICSHSEKWLGEVIAELGSGGNYLTNRSTRDAVRSGEVYFSQLGLHGSYDQWVNSGSPGLLEEIHQDIQDFLTNYHPIPLPELVEKELEALEQRARSRAK
jgi:trimethylamine--corrinoid protein Co-methyltransferase